MTLQPDVNPAATDRRFEALEVKVSFTEDLVEQLNDIVARQQLQIEHLARELAQLRQQQLAADSPAAARNLRDELPPHY